MIDRMRLSELQDRWQSRADI